MLQVPPERISPHALEGIIDEFIMRDGTDYGSEEASHASKVAQIKRQINQGKVLICFDPATESCTLLTAQQWQVLQAQV